MKSCLDFVTIQEAITASRIHLQSAKEHLKLNQLFDVKYELLQTSIHLDMANEIASQKLRDVGVN